MHNDASPRSLIIVKACAIFRSYAYESIVDSTCRRLEAECMQEFMPLVAEGWLRDVRVHCEITDDGRGAAIELTISRLELDGGEWKILKFRIGSDVVMQDGEQGAFKRIGFDVP